MAAAASGGARSVCLLSGGLDSTVCLALAHERGTVELALTVDYGQRAAAAERRASARLAAHFGVAHERIELDLYGGVGGALVDRSRDVPEPSADAIEQGAEELEQSAAAVWVPNRNGVLLQLAAARAEARGLPVVLAGFNREEAATFPDNGPEFLEATNRALAYSTQGRVRVESPTLAMDKPAIAAEALRLGVPVDEIWACYLGGDRPCGRCESCGRLLRAFRAHGVTPAWAPRP